MGAGETAHGSKHNEVDAEVEAPAGGPDQQAGPPDGSAGYQCQFTASAMADIRRIAGDDPAERARLRLATMTLARREHASPVLPELVEDAAARLGMSVPKGGVANAAHAPPARVVLPAAGTSATGPVPGPETAGSTDDGVSGPPGGSGQQKPQEPRAAPEPLRGTAVATADPPADDRSDREPHRVTVADETSPPAVARPKPRRVKVLVRAAAAIIVAIGLSLYVLGVNPRTDPDLAELRNRLASQVDSVRAWLPPIGVLGPQATVEGATVELGNGSGAAPVVAAGGGAPMEEAADLTAPEAAAPTVTGPERVPPDALVPEAGVPDGTPAEEDEVGRQVPDELSVSAVASAFTSADASFEPLEVPIRRQPAAEPPTDPVPMVETAPMADDLPHPAAPAAVETASEESSPAPSPGEPAVGRDDGRGLPAIETASGTPAAEVPVVAAAEGVTTESASEWPAEPEATIAAPAQPPAPADMTPMLERGNQLLELNDLASARLFYRLAAEGGSAEGALRMAMTFDPVFHAERRIRGIPPQAELALDWYARANEMGSAAAAGRTAMLQEWLTRAAQSGDAEAAALLESLR